ncbi:MAG: peptidylprolyl isomerase [Actinobacteria bacterium]|nr:peptidylprolyl isomerase [Actinomycetota bacterium]
MALIGVLTISTTVARGGSSPAEVTIGACLVTHASPPRSAHLRRPPQTITRSDRLVAIVKTNCGRFQIRLDARRAPITVNSFVYLARSGFYRGLDFYRVVPNFVIQGGDPREAGTGGPGYSTTEPPPRHFRFHLGTVAMAKRLADPPGRAGSVFFVVAGSEGRLIADEYAILGHVSAGMSTVERIDALGTKGERPSQVVKIEWIKIRDLGRV